MIDKNSEWFEDTDFWEKFAPIMFDDAHWAEVPDVADGVTHLANLDLYNNPSLTSAPKLLDICCGFGRISTELARRGFAVTGVDITESYLQTAKEDAADENLDIEYINADARKFSRENYFDAAVNLYTSFGYFANPKEDLLLVSNVYKSLKKGGSFIIETLGKEIAVLNFVETEWFERAGYKVLTEYEVLDSWSILKNRWILLKDGKTFEKTFTQRLYSASELRALMLEAGFEKVDIYGSWNESIYDHRAERLIVVGRK
jgi:2-polyprenyl-3-methyl-5-hydroxy-6-metoxy-1,4-benzoquinol methylase